MPIKLNKYHYLIACLSILLCVSGIGNIILYQKVKETYLKVYKVSLNPLGINRYKFNPKKINRDKLNIVFYGDSRAAQWKHPSIEQFQFINRGISGQTSAQVLGRFDSHVTPLKPKVIILQVCINDLRMLPSTPKTRKDIIEDCKNNIDQIISKAQNIPSDIIITTIFPLSNSNIPLRSRPFFPSLSDLEKSVEEVNEYIKKLEISPTKDNGNRVIIFDAYSVLNQEDPNKVKYYRDLFHLNQKGYKLLNQRLESILNNLEIGF